LNAHPIPSAFLEIWGHRPGTAATFHLLKRLQLETGTVGAADLGGDTVGGLVVTHFGEVAMEIPPSGSRTSCRFVPSSQLRWAAS